MSEKMTKCKSCGNDIASSAKNCPGCGAKNKKPIFKKWWFWLIIVLVLIVIIGTTGGDDTDTGATNAASGDSSVSQAVVKTEANKDNKLGKYQLEIKNARMTETYDGKPAVVITYGFTNNSDKPASFYVSIDENVYQNDIGLNEAIILTSSDDYSSDNQRKEIKTGASLDVDVAYELNDSESDIVVEAKEYFSFTDDIISRTFSIG